MVQVGFENGVLLAQNVNFSVNTDPNHAGIITADGQLLIGAPTSDPDGAVLVAGNLVAGSAAVTVTYNYPNIEIDLAGSSAAIQEIDMQAGISPIVPTAGVVVFNGAVVAAGTNPVRTNGTAANTGALEVQISQAIGGADATKIGLSNFSSTDFAVAATGFVTLSTTGAGKLITGNSGGAISPVANNWTLITANSTPTFVGTAGTQTLDFGLSNLVLGTSAPAITVGTGNVGLGQNVMVALTSGSGNVIVGHLAAPLLDTGSNNVAIGKGTMSVMTGSVQNVGIGNFALNNMTTSVGSNTAIGYSALASITTGRSNISIGVSSSSSLITTESSNIIIGNTGVVGDNNKIRIGRAGSSAGQQDAAFIAGITAVTVAGSEPVSVDTNGQLSGLGFGSSGQVLTSTGAASSPTWQANSSLAWSVITGASQAMAINNGYIANRAGTVAFTLPTTSAVGDIIEVTGINTATGWSISWTTNQQVFFGTATTTVTTGSLASSAIRDSVRMVCVVADLTWNVLSSVGNITCV